MSSEWPIRADAQTRSRVNDSVLDRPRAPAERVHAVGTDLFVPPSHRMSDRVRAYVATMLDSLTDAFERQLRDALAPRFADRPELAASLGSKSVEIAAPLLRDARTLAHPPLIRVVLRRADEFVLSRRLASAADGADPLADDPDPDIASAATALAIAEARRIDRFGAPALLPDDLPAEVAHWMGWQVAAALRYYLRMQHAVDAADADAALHAEARVVLARHDEGAGIRPACARFAARLSAAGRNDGAMLQALLVAGRIGAFTASLAPLAGVPDDETWNLVADPTDGRLALLLRAAGCEREAAAAILLALTPDPVAEIDRFDGCDRDGASRAVAGLALPRVYRDATRTLEAALSHLEARP